MPILVHESSAVYQDRRKKLLESVASNHKDDGVILLFGNFEQEGYSYKQDPSFFYCTGVEEPACVLMLEKESGKSTLFVPNTGGVRGSWVANPIEPDTKRAAALGVDAIEYLGEPCVGYQCHPFFSKHEYGKLIEKIASLAKAGKKIFTINPQTSYGYLEQRFVIQRLANIISGLDDKLIDISSEIARLRRKKSKREIEHLYKAIKTTAIGLEAAAQSIAPDKYEYEVQAALEYIFTADGASIAFPTIVGSGHHSTTLHYMENNQLIEKNGLVVVDCGARYNNYCADISRTFPVSGKFTERQKEIYNLVLETQTYIADLAKPGMWLSNKDEPDKSLNHLAKKFLEEKGYGKYFIHGIGHFLGLDVHDVGDYKEPLQPGDVITIEPGIYIPEEELGVRIEDDYWIVEGGNICLSEDIPKAWDEVEALVKRSFEEPEE